MTNFITDPRPRIKTKIPVININTVIDKVPHFRPISAEVKPILALLVDLICVELMEGKTVVFGKYFSIRSKYSGNQTAPVRIEAQLTKEGNTLFNNEKTKESLKDIMRARGLGQQFWQAGCEAKSEEQAGNFVTQDEARIINLVNNLIRTIGIEQEEEEEEEEEEELEEEYRVEQAEEAEDIVEEFSTKTK